MFDTTNPSAMKNFLISQMKEGKGKFEYRHNVLVFKDMGGNEYVAPKEVEEFLDAKDMPKKMDANVAEPVEEVSQMETATVEIALEPDPIEETKEKPTKKAGRPKKVTE